MLMVCNLLWSLLLGVPFIHVPGVPVLTKHPLIQKVVKGAYNSRPPTPRYVVIWDTDVLLQYLDSLDNACLNFKLLSCKTAILLTILSGQRVSTIHAFRLSQLQLTSDMAVFNLGTTLLKHSRPGVSTPPIVFHCTLMDGGCVLYKPSGIMWLNVPSLLHRLTSFLSLTTSPIVRLPRIPYRVHALFSKFHFLTFTDYLSWKVYNLSWPTQEIIYYFSWPVSWKREFWNLILNEWLNFIIKSTIPSPWLRTLLNDSIYHPYSIPSPWFKEILKFDLPEASILVQFYYLTYIHSFTMVEENFEICPSEIVQNDLMYHQHLFTIMFVITL